MIRKIFLFGLLLVIRQASAQDTLRVAQFAGIGALTKFAIAHEALTAGDAVFIRPDNKRVQKADRTNTPSKTDAQAICLQTADEDSLIWIITNGRVFEWPEALVIGETYYLADTIGHISIYPPASGPIQKIGVAVDTFTLDVNIQKPLLSPIIKGVENIDFEEADEDGGSAFEDVTVIGAEVGDFVVVSPPPAALINRVVFHAYVFDDDTVRITLYNNSAAPVNIGAADYVILLIK